MYKEWVAKIQATETCPESDHGMKIGEARTIYVHPDLPFGLGKLDIAPNRLIVFEDLATFTK